MQVVEDEHDRAVGGGALQESRNRVEQAHALAPGCPFRQLRQQLRQFGKDLHDLRRSGPELRAQAAEVRVVESHPERLHPGPVRRCAAGLPAPADKHFYAPRTRASGELLGDPALADSRLADEQEEPPPTRDGVVESC